MAKEIVFGVAFSNEGGQLIVKLARTPKEGHTLHAQGFIIHPYEVDIDDESALKLVEMLVTNDMMAQHFQELMGFAGQKAAEIAAYYVRQNANKRWRQIRRRRHKQW